ncbi:MAG TPA: amidohydrolase family protein [Acidimicrobiales bacterium]|nr:amidohydrolase family protein [Acidimicrobiales bacterium]
MAEHDLVIRAGTVVDGTGSPPRTADVSVDGDRITEVGAVATAGRREVDADGLLVTPGFVDIHCHYDGQATWDSRLLPSAWHGVTTIVMGNCGVGFAPVRPADHDRLIELMEGVEDIPGAALHEGLEWSWQTFGEYLDALEARPHDIDFAAQVPHGALRLHAMGGRGSDHTARPTEEEIAEMGRLAADGVAAGALGFTTSRTKNHRTSRGEYTPSLTAGRDELVGIAAGLGGLGAGVLQVVSDFRDVDGEMETLRAMASTSGRPLSISVAAGSSGGDNHRRVLAAIEAMNAEGLEVRAQVATRGIGVLLGLQASINPFSRCPSYREVADLALPERLVALREPARRAAIVAEWPDRPLPYGEAFTRVFTLGDPPDYEPSAEASVAAEAARQGRPAVELAYDLLLADEGRTLLYSPILNYPGGNLDTARELLTHPYAVPGLGDGGAHVGTICDASFPSTLLTHWCRDRDRGRLDLPFVIRGQCRETARTVGLHDRGVLAPGYRADINVIDFDALRIHPPHLEFDLPADGKRLLQGADGYRPTFVAGQEVYADGIATGALPGRLVRGAQPAPVPA